MKTVVLKLGGSALENSLDELSVTLKGLRAKGTRVVVVHGGGPAINQQLNARGITWTFVNGQRRTTPEMINVIDEVLSIQVNGKVVAALKAAGLKARGLSGARNGILMCSQLNEDLGLVGQVDMVATGEITRALANGEIPVIAPVGVGFHSKFNVNADWAATKIATALNADELIFLTDQHGILNMDQELIPRATPSFMTSLIESGVITGGMCTKVLAMIYALEHGVGSVRVLNAVKSSGILGRNQVGTILTQTRDVILHETEQFAS